MFVAGSEPNPYCYITVAPWKFRFESYLSPNGGEHELCYGGCLSKKWQHVWSVDTSPEGALFISELLLFWNCVFVLKVHKMNAFKGGYVSVCPQVSLLKLLNTYWRNFVLGVYIKVFKADLVYIGPARSLPYTNSNWTCLLKMACCMKIDTLHKIKIRLIFVTLARTFN